MGICFALPSTPVVTHKLQKAIFKDGIEAGLKLMQLKDIDAVVEVDGRAMCGTAMSDPEATASWAVSHGDLADFENPQRLLVFKWLARLELEMDWNQGFTLGGLHDGQLGACCTVVPYLHGYSSSLLKEASQMTKLAKDLVLGRAPEAVTSSQYRAWRKAFLAKLMAKQGLLSTLSHAHEKYGDMPHYYISLMMVDPRFQGKGLCGRLMRAACCAADADGVPTFLVTGGARNVAVYERFGFRVLEKTSLVAEGYDSYGEFYSMVRDAPEIATVTVG